MKWLKYLQDEQGLITIFQDQSEGYVVQEGTSTSERKRVHYKSLELVYEVLAERFERDEVLDGLEE